MQDFKRVEAQGTAYAGSERVQKDVKTGKTHWSKPLLIVYLILLALAILTAVRSVKAYESTKVLIQNLQEQTTQILLEKQKVEEELTAVKQQLESTEGQFKQSFNILYPAYAAVNNVRFVAKDEAVYHRYECTVFEAEDGLYTAHNTEYCELLGYVPCPSCCP